MDVVLTALTVISLIAAVVFAVVAWRMLADDRRRSAARVAALASAIDGGVPRTAPASASAPVAVASMFTTAPGGSLKGRPLIKAAVVATMGIAIVVAVAMSSRGQDESPTPAASATRQAAPLELVSMRHAREGSSLTISGLVRNPRAGSPAARITAVVFAFDKDGTFVASGRAPLDFTTLEPGDESPFVVTIPNVANVGRYRVSFRTESGMLRHVDRRSDHMRLAAARRPEA